MIKFISHNTSPSVETWAKIQMIRLLNQNGIDAILFGPSHWPEQFVPYKHLNEFFPNESDIVIVDGLLLKRWSDVLQISINRYSHGRKLLLINMVKYVLHVATSKLWWTRKLRLTLYKAHPKQHNFNIFDSKNLEEKLNLKSFLNYTSHKFNAEQNELIIFEDISSANNTHIKITETEAKTITLAGAIIEPGYFKEYIVPLINSKQKKISYTGSNSEFYEKIELIKDTSALLQNIKQLFTNQ